MKPVRFVFEKKTVILLILTVSLIVITILTSIRLTQKDTPESSVAPVKTKASSKTYTKFLALNNPVTPTPEAVPTETTTVPTEGVVPTETLLAQAGTLTPTPDVEFGASDSSSLAQGGGVGGVGITETPVPTETTESVTASSSSSSSPSEIPSVGVIHYTIVLGLIALTIIAVSFLY